MLTFTRYLDRCTSQATLPLSRVLEQMNQPAASLAYCNLGSKGGLALAECLQHNRVATSLDIRSNDFKAAASQQIMRSLQHNLFITKLDLSDNVLGSAAVDTLADTLKTPKCPLVSFLGDAQSSLGDAKSSLGDTKISLGDAKSSLGDAKSSRWVTLRAR